VVEAICEVNTLFPYIPGLVLMMGRTFANVTVEHHPRSEGRSNYTPRAIIKLVWRLVFNYSAFPLRFLCAVGVMLSILSFGLGGFFVVRNLIHRSAVPGWTSLMVLISMYQGFTLIVLAAIGEYVVRILNDVSGRKPYRIRKKT
jgi:polyisoprenyl-phosphate glycosyltransferase